MKRPWARALNVVWLALLPTASHAAESTGVPAEASTEQVERCVADHDSARQLRLREQWFEARAAITACASDRCPLAIGADCRAWLEDLNHALPTLLVLVERDHARQPSGVELDGRALELHDPPVPVEVVPGPHRLRATFADHEPIEREFTLRIGEKNHLERVELPAPAISAPIVIREPPPAPSRPVRTSTYLLSAGALAAFAGSSAFLVSALRERDDARMSCAPTCDPSVRRGIETRLVLADVSAGAGLVLGAWAVYTFVKRPVVQLGHAGPTFFASQNSLRLAWKGQF